MPSEEQMRLFGLYGAIMEEAKVRLSSLGSAMAGAVGIPKALAREFCFLQLRMLCELIALGCLAAHGDIQGTTGLRKKYAADDIIKRLECLHPDFYPSPVRLDGGASKTRFATPIESGFLTKDELLSLYRRCGAALHRGTLRKLLSEQVPSRADFRDIVVWENLIVVLLTVHFIQLHDGERMFCMLRNVDDGNHVQVTVLSLNLPPQPSI